MTTLAGGNDVLAAFLTVPVETLTVLFLWALPIVPVVTWLLVFLLARQRQRRGEATEGPASGGSRVIRNAAGGFDPEAAS